MMAVAKVQSDSEEEPVTFTKSDRPFEDDIIQGVQVKIIIQKRKVTKAISKIESLQKTI